MHLQVVFAAPMFSVTERRLVVRLGEIELYDGRFETGFSSDIELTPGRYALDTAIDGPMLGRAQSFDLVLDAESGYRTVPFVRATLDYSPLTGAFKCRMALLARR
jgi:hypothetical protein